MIPHSELIINADGSIYHLGLKPEHIAHTILTVGDPERVPEVSRHFDTIQVKCNRREFVTHTGTLNGKRLTVISSGMGTDNVEILLTELDALVNIDFKTRSPQSQITLLTIIRLGTSGTIDANIQLGSLLISEFAVGVDTLMNFYDLPQTDFERGLSNTLQQYLSLPFAPYAVSASAALLDKFSGITKGVTLTCPGFYAPQGRKLRLNPIIDNYVQKLQNFQYQKHAITNLEMETAGYYALARLMGHQAISLNTILANRSTGEFSANPQKEVSNMIAFALSKITS
jgi:uridine phosphorylase